MQKRFQKTSKPKKPKRGSNTTSTRPSKHVHFNSTTSANTTTTITTTATTTTATTSLPDTTTTFTETDVITTTDGDEIMEIFVGNDDDGDDDNNDNDNDDHGSNKGDIIERPSTHSPHRYDKMMTKKKAMKHRRDHKEVRQKGLSKSNKVFRKLMRSGGGGSCSGGSGGCDSVMEVHQCVSLQELDGDRNNNRGDDDGDDDDVNHRLRFKRTHKDAILSDDTIDDHMKSWRVGGGEYKKVYVDMVDGITTTATTNSDGIVVDNDGIIEDSVGASSKGLLKRCVIM